MVEITRKELIIRAIESKEVKLDNDNKFMIIPNEDRTEEISVPIDEYNSALMDYKYGKDYNF